MVKKTVRTMGIILLVVLILSGYGVSMALHTNTIVVWWLPPVISVLVALATAPLSGRYWSWVLDTDQRWVNYGLHAVVVTAILTGLFYAGNFLLRSDSEPEMRTATVTRLYREKHYKTRRIGRTYRQGDPYWVDKMDYTFADGFTKSLTLPRRRRRSLQPGDTIRVPVRPGFFGVDVAETSSIIFPPSTSSAGMRSRRLQRGR